MDGEYIESLVNAAARIALEGIVRLSYTRAERERLEHAARTVNGHRGNHPGRGGIL